MLAVLGLSACGAFSVIETTARQVLVAPPLARDIATTILSVLDESGDELSDEFAEFDKLKRADFANLYPYAK